MITNLHIFNDFSVHYNIDVTNKKKNNFQNSTS